MHRAVAIIFGTAFGKISTPLVNDILTPPIGLLLCGVALQRAAHHAGFRRSIDTSPSPSRRRCHAQLWSVHQRRRPLRDHRRCDVRGGPADQLAEAAQRDARRADLGPRDEERPVPRLCDPGGGVEVSTLHVQVDKRPRNVDLWCFDQRRAENRF